MGRPELGRVWARCGVRGWALACAAAASVALFGIPPKAVASTARGRIVALAARELGYREPGDYCTKFGPCEEWCSLFVTWVWRRAGVPVPSLPFTGSLYDWAKGRTAVRARSEVPKPGDAVLFGTGPSSPATSRHVGIVEAAYPGYLVTIEGDSLHGVRRFVVPFRNPQRVGEPGPIYAYASPVGRGHGGQEAIHRLLARFTGRAPAVVARKRTPRPRSKEMRRLLSAIAALRAFQHMPYRTAQLQIDWTGVNGRGLVLVRVRSAMHISYAGRAWRRFLHRFNDAGRAYSVSFQAPPDVPVDSFAPSISGSPSEGQALTDAHGMWSNDPTAYSYQWQRCDSSGERCVAIAGATSQSYVLTADDVGHTIRVQETASNAGGPGAPATSAPTTVVAPPPSQ